jgi:hypothetical protein
MHMRTVRTVYPKGAKYQTVLLLKVTPKNFILYKTFYYCINELHEMATISIQNVATRLLVRTGEAINYPYIIK